MNNKIFIHSHFNDFYPFLYVETQKCLNKWVDLIPLAFFVFNCNFLNSIELKENGGIIYSNKKGIYMVIESCLFHNCSVNDINQGGAIYFYGKSSVIYKTCCSKCFAKNYLFGILNSDFNEINNLLYCSITSLNSTIGSCPISLSSGNLTIKNLNNSNNHLISISSLRISNPNSLNFRYSNIVNNYCISQTSILFLSGYNDCEIFYCNIIKNFCEKSNVISIEYLNPNYNFIQCIFNLNYPFLFRILNGKVFLHQCFINHNESLIYTGLNNISLSNISYEITETYSIIHFETYFCEADFPFTPEYTLKNPTLINSPIETLPITSIYTPLITLKQTFHDTPINTIKNTYLPTETISNKSNIGISPLILIIFTFSILIIIILLIYCYLNIQKDEFINFTSI